MGAFGNPQKILVVNPFGIGDVVFSFDLAEALKASLAGCVIDYVANERTHEIVAMNPTVRKTFVFNRDRFRSLARGMPARFLGEAGALLSGIRRERYDTAFDLSLGRDVAFFLMMCGVRDRVGFDWRGRGFFLTERTEIRGFNDRPMRDYYTGLAERRLGPAFRRGARPVLAVPAIARREAEAWCAARGIMREDFVAVVAPGGGKSWGENARFKQWDPGLFAESARSLASRRGAKIVVMGDGDEKELCEKVASAAGPGAGVMAGEPLAVAAAVLRRADLFVGNDGGLMHLADLVGAPLVGIYGPVDENVYGPAPSERAEAVFHDVPCRPCYRSFRFPPCPHSKRCLDDLPVEAVLSAAERVAAHSGVR